MIPKLEKWQDKIMRISIIAAIATNRALGKGNKLIYAISDDLKRFKEITLGHPIIMGRKTFESIGRALPSRTNIVITRDPNFSTKEVVVVNSLEKALEEAKKVEDQEIFIIGGGQIFQQSIGFADKLYLTIIEDNPEADTFFPDYSDFTKKVFEESHESDGIKYRFLDLKR